MKKIEIINTSEMSEFMATRDLLEVSFPESSNILLTTSRVSTDCLLEAQNIAQKSNRYLHLC